MDFFTLFSPDGVMLETNVVLRDPLIISPKRNHV